MADETTGAPTRRATSTPTRHGETSVSAGERDRRLDTAVAAFFDAQVEHARLVHHLAASHGLNPIDLQAVQFLGGCARNPTPKELGEHLARGTGAITALIDRLADRGLLERVRNADDRRSVRIGLTDEGLDVVRSLTTRYREAAQRSVPVEHIDLLAHASRRLARALRDSTTSSG
ncbi:MarR family transcriptional regulator [Curtobacterium flaccumfaciens]|nr:MarR family transcriptional regulator [Curtobacterium flaccumfaciens]